MNLIVELRKLERHIGFDIYQIILDFVWEPNMIWKHNKKRNKFTFNTFKINELMKWKNEQPYTIDIQFYINSTLTIIRTPTKMYEIFITYDKYDNKTKYIIGEYAKRPVWMHNVLKRLFTYNDKQYTENEYILCDFENNS